MSLLNQLFRKKSIQQALQNAEDEALLGAGLHKNLTVRDLTALGIAAIIGAGIFSTIGNASANGGPAVVFLFIFTAVACGFAALAYAEFASLVPISGSAYTYSYVAFGELVAWVIGWALLMEYAVGNITVAVSWSGYFTSLCDSAGWHIPAWATVDYVSAHAGFNDVEALLKGGSQLADLNSAQRENHEAWTSAPTMFGLKTILDLPAMTMSILITGLVYIGMQESKRVGNAMVVLKLIVVLAVIVVGAFYVDVHNWHPFVPNGMGGVMKGVSAVFFAYIGFDALSTTAEECVNPQRDLPRAMIYSIVICTVLYIVVSLVLTGMVPYSELGVNDPLSFVFQKIGLDWFSGIIAVSAVVAMAGVFLVFQLGQPRIWMVMSRDGLLPKKFSEIHPKYRTPAFATIITGLFVVVPMLFIPSDTVLNLCSMGTLFAFVLVCAGVLKMQLDPTAPRGKFRAPYINSKWLFPLMLAAIGAFLFTKNKAETLAWVRNEPEAKWPMDILHNLSTDQIAQINGALTRSDSQNFAKADNNLVHYFEDLDPAGQRIFLENLPLTAAQKFDSGWNLFKHKIPMWLFVFTCLGMGWLAFRHSLSLIPTLGMVTCMYMMAEIPASSWLGFFIWLVAGLGIYFGYSVKHSKLNGASRDSL